MSKRSGTAQPFSESQALIEELRKVADEVGDDAADLYLAAAQRIAYLEAKVAGEAW